MQDFLFFDFHGITLSVCCADQQIREWLEFDFGYFLCPEIQNVNVQLTATLGPIPKDLVPSLEETIHSPEFVAYDSKKIRSELHGVFAGKLDDLSRDMNC